MYSTLIWREDILLLVWQEDIPLWFGRKILYFGLAGRYPTLVWQEDTLVWQEDILLWFGRNVLYSGLVGRYSTMHWQEDTLLRIGRKIQQSQFQCRWIGGWGGGGGGSGLGSVG